MDGLGTLLHRFAPITFPAGPLGFPYLRRANYFFHQREPREKFLFELMERVFGELVEKLQGGEGNGVSLGLN